MKVWLVKCLVEACGDRLWLCRDMVFLSVKFRYCESRDHTSRIVALTIFFSSGPNLPHPHTKHTHYLSQWFSLLRCNIYLLLFIFIFNCFYTVFVLNSYDPMLCSYFCKYLRVDFLGEDQSSFLFVFYRNRTPFHGSLL